MDWYWWVLIILAVLYFWIYKAHYAKQERLMAKYNDEALVERIMDGEYWQGQSSDTLLDSLGKPSKIDHKVLKTKSKEVWKYYEIAKNRYELKITLENDTVVGWDKK